MTFHKNQLLFLPLGCQFESDRNNTFLFLFSFLFSPLVSMNHYLKICLCYFNTTASLFVATHVVLKPHDLLPTAHHLLCRWRLQVTNSCDHIFAIFPSTLKRERFLTAPLRQIHEFLFL